jgi:Tfp pilus assembly protein PilX
VKKQRVKSILGNERGIVLPIALALLAIAILFGTTAFVVTRTDIRITGNYKWGEQAHYLAEAGTEEFRARIRPTAANRIVDASPTDTAWVGFIGSSQAASAMGITPSQRWDSIQNALNYTAVLRHRTDASGTQVLKWGDDNADGVPTRNTTTGENIYVVRSYASTASASKIVEVEVANFPPWSGGGTALYTEAPTTIQGTSTYISGEGGGDGNGGPGTRCGDPVVAIQSTLGPGGVSVEKGKGGGNGGPVIEGAPASPPDPTSIGSAPNNLDLQGMIDAYKVFATPGMSYKVNSATNTGMTWGTPTTPDPALHIASSCSEWNIVYYNTLVNGSPTDIKLAGGTKGCGMLLVEGDLEINGGFNWYGVILVTENIKYTGGGEKQITGMVLAGGSADADLFGGDASIIYCAEATKNATEKQPALRLSWKEVM